ncbi:MAG: DNA-processing protein DprA [Thermomicrobiales bacterium]
MPETFNLEATDPALPPWVRRVWPAERSTLHGIGTLDWSKPALSIVGSTRPSPVARTWAFDLARAAASRGWSVVSGLAIGIDSYAHEGAIAGGGHTLAVVAYGIDQHSLKSKRSLLSRIVNADGAILSISEPGERPTRERLLLRNRWTSAFGIGVVAVQSRGRDGTLATMRHAFHQGRLIATFQPPSDGAPEHWNGNELLLSDTPPWRLDHSSNYAWQPLRRVSGSSKFDDLFAALDAHHELLRTLDASGAPKSPTQRRLLEERARLEISQ